jgi:lipopolysaccharide transport system permease protein
MIILTLVFSLLLHLSIPNYAAWVLLGLLVWRFFSIGTAQSLSSIVGNPSLVGKVYLPRYLIVLSNNLANLLGAAFEFIALLPLIVILGVKLTVFVFLLPLILGMEFLLIFGLSLALSALNLKYRDFYQMWDIALQLGFFLSPTIYDPSLIPVRYQFVYFLNPVTRLMDATRDIFLSSRPPSLFDIAPVLLASAILLGIGFMIFRHFEPRFAEEI